MASCTNNWTLNIPLGSSFPGLRKCAIRTPHQGFWMTMRPVDGVAWPEAMELGSSMVSNNVLQCTVAPSDPDSSLAWAVSRRSNCQ